MTGPARVLKPGRLGAPRCPHCHWRSPPPLGSAGCLAHHGRSCPSFGVHGLCLHSPALLQEFFQYFPWKLPAAKPQRAAPGLVYRAIPSLPTQVVPHSIVLSACGVEGREGLADVISIRNHLTNQILLSRTGKHLVHNFERSRSTLGSTSVVLGIYGARWVTIHKCFGQARPSHGEVWLVRLPWSMDSLS